MPSWELIYEEVEDKLHDEKYYEFKEKEFENKLKDIGVVYFKDGESECDVLLRYNLPIKRINNKEWINQFCDIIKEYKTSFNEEMKLIYGV